jgi:hypothetical protein
MIKKIRMGLAILMSPRLKKLSNSILWKRKKSKSQKKIKRRKKSRRNKKKTRKKKSQKKTPAQTKKSPIKSKKR